jgi:hypothetical protein
MGASRSPLLSWWDCLCTYTSLAEKTGGRVNSDNPMSAPAIFKQNHLEPHRKELFGILFAHENMNEGTGSSYYRKETRCEFETSRAPRLLVILQRLAMERYCDGATRHEHQHGHLLTRDRDVDDVLSPEALIKVLIEVGKWGIDHDWAYSTGDPAKCPISQSVSHKLRIYLS